MLYELLYSSAAAKKMSAAELVRLLEQARAKNARLGITGLLVYHNREFMQLLEGERDEVQSLWQTIRFDDRHTSVRVIYEGPIEERGFASWRMGFRNLGKVDVEALAGYSRFLESGFTTEVNTQHQSIARDLMITIRDFLFVS